MWEVERGGGKVWEVESGGGEVGKVKWGRWGVGARSGDGGCMTEHKLNQLMKPTVYIHLHVCTKYRYMYIATSSPPLSACCCTMYMNNHVHSALQ